MSFLKKLGLGAGSFLLSLLLVATLMTFSVAQITSAETLRPFVADIAGQRLFQNLSADESALIYSELTTQCDATGAGTVTAPVASEDASEVTNLSLSCAELRGFGPEGIGKVYGGAIFDELYYAKPDCAYPMCFFDQHMGANAFTTYLSEEANKFYQTMFYVLVALTVLVAIGLVRLGKSWTSLAKSFGLSLVIAGIPVFGISLIKSSIPAEAAALIGSAADPLFDALSTNFLFVFITGVTLLAIGLIGSKLRPEEEE
jgi:hypothetical protein